jgi:hypothetical protein
MQVNLTGISILLAMPVFDNIPAGTVKCLLETQSACARHGIAIDIEMNVGSTVFHARSLAAHRFLKSEHNRMFMVDSDMVWTTDSFFRLLALSTKMDCVSATYTAKTEPAKFYVGLKNTSKVVTNQWGCMPIEGVGLGFTIVTRKLMEELAKKAPLLTFSVSLPGEKVAKIFRFDEPDGEARGEDMAFFSDVKALGYQPYLDQSVDLGHIGTKEYRGRFADQLVRI